MIQIITERNTDLGRHWYRRWVSYHVNDYGVVTVAHAFTRRGSYRKLFRKIGF